MELLISFRKQQGLCDLHVNSSHTWTEAEITSIMAVQQVVSNLSMVIYWQIFKTSPVDLESEEKP